MMSNAAYALSDRDYRLAEPADTLSNRETLSGSDMQEKIQRINAEFRMLLTLPPNWDSYGARPIKISSVSAAFDILLQVIRADMPDPSIVPTPDGHVQVEWHTRNIDLEIEVISPTSIHVWYEDYRAGEGAKEVELGYDLTFLHNAVHEISSRDG